MSELPNMHDAEPIPASARAEIDRLLQSGDLFRYTASENAPVSLLETEFAERMGAQYALAVSSCSAALFLSLKALGLPRDSKVLIPAFTFAAVPSAIVHADCVPLLCECGPNYRIDLSDFETKLADVDAVMISHMRGHTSDMDVILELSAARGIPVIEDAAHSLGTRWNGQLLGTLGKVGCFSFQSYKMLNAGEGGILISDDPDVIARAVILSGAYEHNWKKHPVLHDAFAKWQNKLPLYNLRMSNLSAAVIRPQLDEMDRRVRDGRRNHDHVARHIKQSPWITVPDALPQEDRAPDSLQFSLIGVSDDDVDGFVKTCKDKGLSIQVFGRSKDNARAFWNWEFLGKAPSLPKTREMLSRACDCRLPARLTLQDCDQVAEVILSAINEVMQSRTSVPA